MKWYKGDLHSHSTFSDGKETLDVLFKKVRQHGLEFFALTEHRSVEPLKHLPENPGTLVIPAFEFGSKLGHANIFGLTELLSENKSLEVEQTKESLQEAREAGGMIAINHPFHYESTWFVPLEETIYDWIELWNGPWFNSNQNCLDWWQGELEKGKVIPVAGGSDCHANLPFHYYGQPTTWVYAQELNVQSLLQSLKQGHTVLSYSPDGPFINLTCGDSVVGDIVKDKTSICNLEINGLKATDKIRIISDQAVEKEIQSDASDFHLTLDIQERKFIRVEVLSYFDELMSYQMAALSNPIYFQ